MCTKDPCSVIRVNVHRFPGNDDCVCKPTKDVKLLHVNSMFLAFLAMTNIRTMGFPLDVGHRGLDWKRMRHFRFSSQQQISVYAHVWWFVYESGRVINLRHDEFCGRDLQGTDIMRRGLQMHDIIVELYEMPEWSSFSNGVLVDHDGYLLCDQLGKWISGDTDSGYSHLKYVVDIFKKTMSDVESENLREIIENGCRELLL